MLDIEYLRQINILSIIVRLCLAMLFGGIIGFERERKKRPAGLRTHILVCIGATLTMITNQYIVEHLQMGGDPTRLGAQVISGIGFLGAGTIIVTGKQQVKGLTTAAGLWASACMGLAIGIGFYEGALIGCLFILGGISILQKLDFYMLTPMKEVAFYIEIESVQQVGEMLLYLKEAKIHVITLELTPSTRIGQGQTGILIGLKVEHALSNQSLVEIFANLPQILYIEEI